MAARMAARVAWVDNDLAGITAAWDQQTAPPQGPLDYLVLGEGRAAAGDPRALASADALEDLLPTEAALIRARLAMESGQGDDAITHLRQAFIQAHADPWVHPRALSRGLLLAIELAQQGGPQAAAALLQPLLTPFSVSNLDDNRRSIVIQLSSIAGFAQWCQQAFATIEPYPAWYSTLLASRVRCYEQTSSDLLPIARHDLDRFERMQARAPP